MWREIIALGGFFIVWAGVGFTVPIADNGWSVSTFDQLCQADVDQYEISLIDGFGPCQVSSYLIINNYAYLGVGIGLVITGSISKKI